MLKIYILKYIIYTLKLYNISFSTSHLAFNYIWRLNRRIKRGRKVLNSHNFFFQKSEMDFFNTFSLYIYILQENFCFYIHRLKDILAIDLPARFY